MTIAPARSSNVLIYCIAQGVSSTGSWMQRAGMGWLIWTLTHSPAWVGALAFTDVAALISVGLWSGAVADRQSAYRLLMVTQLLMIAQSIALFAVVLAGRQTVWLLLGLGVIDSAIQAFNQPVRLTAISLISPRDRLSQAIASNSLAFNLARIAGPAAAGAVMVHGVVAPVFAINAASFLAMVAAVAYLRPWIDRAGSEPTSDFVGEIVAGLRYVRHMRKIGALFLLTAAFSLLARPVTELLPALAGAVFHGGPALMSGLMSAQGAGAMLGALFMLRRRSNRRTLLFAFLGGLGLAAAAVVIALGSTARMAIAAMIFAGTSQVICNIATQSLVQYYSDERFRGRVMALYGVLYRAAPSLGAFVIGLGAEKLSLRWLLGAAALGGAIFIGLVWKRSTRVFGQPALAA